MEYYEEGGSEKHLTDITGVLKGLGARVNRKYIEESAVAYDLIHVWDAVLKRMGEVKG